MFLVQKDFELHLQEKSLARSSQDLHCTISGTTQNLLTDLHQSLLLQEPTDATLGVLAGKQNTSHLPWTASGPRSHQTTSLMFNTSFAFVDTTIESKEN